MKKYSIFKTPVLAWCSKDFYHDVARRWRGVGFGYLLLLLMACWIVPTIQMHKTLGTFIDTEAPKIVKQIPKLTITNGEASIDMPEPHRIVEPWTGKTIVVIDTTGSINTLEEADDAPILIKKHEAIMRKNEFQSQTLEFKDIDDFTFDKSDVQGWVDFAKPIAAPALYVPIVLGVYVFRILQALIYGCLGLFIASLCKVKLSYAAALRLSIVAVTPPIIIETVLDITGVHIPEAALCYFGLTMCFLLFGVKAAGVDDTQPEEPIAPIAPQPLTPLIPLVPAAQVTPPPVDWETAPGLPESDENASG